MGARMVTPGRGETQGFRPLFVACRRKRRRYDGAAVPAVPAVSVLLPFRDAASTLEEALDSILAQRGISLEVVAIDDGSRDASSAIAQRMAACHRALRIIRTEGLGIAPALQLASQHAESELIARITAKDPDTRMPPADSGKTLTAEQIDTLRKWIAQGAELKPHWSFVAPTRNGLD